MWEILQKKVYKTRITDLNEPTQQLRTERAKLDHDVIAAAIRQWHRQCHGSRSVMRVLYTSAVFRSWFNQMDSNLANLEATVEME